MILLPYPDLPKHRSDAESKPKEIKPMKGQKEYLATYPDLDGGNVSVWEFDSK